jgi:hypothetical protein
MNWGEIFLGLNEIFLYNCPLINFITIKFRLCLRQKIIDIASDVKSEQFVKHSFPEVDAEFSVLRTAVLLQPFSVIDEYSQRKLIEKCMRTLDVSSEVVSIEIIQRYIKIICGCLKILNYLA